jgi:hypothetical protein
VELRSAKRKFHPELILQPKGEAFRTLHHALYGCGGEPWETVESLSLKYSGCNLKEGLCSFDGWFVFLVSGGSEQRLLWRQGYGDEEIMEATFPIGTFESVVSDCISAVSADRTRCAASAAAAATEKK